jgi:hypothetical protein
MKNQNNGALHPSWIRRVALAMILCLGLNALVPVAAASPISSAAMVTGTTRTADLASIQLALEHKVVKQRLGELGFTSAEINQRLAHASDAELHQLATESQNLQAGGFLIEILVVVILIMVIMRLARTADVSQPTVMAV